MRFAPIVLATAFVLSACAIRPRAQEPDAGAGRIISSETIAKSGARTMWDALVLNVKHTSFGHDGSGAATGASKRGASSISFQDRVAIFLDHQRIYNIELLQQMPARSIDRIQVLSGLDGTTYYGTNAGDGVIRIITKVGTEGEGSRLLGGEAAP